MKDYQNFKDYKEHKKAVVLTNDFKHANKRTKLKSIPQSQEHKKLSLRYFKTTEIDENAIKFYADIKERNTKNKRKRKAKTDELIETTKRRNKK